MQVEKQLVKGKYFRVMPISIVTGLDDSGELTFEQLDIKEGLAIEQNQGDWYCVVAFVKPHIKKPNPLNGQEIEFASIGDGLELEDVDFRTVDMLDEDMSMEDFWEMMQEYRNCVEFARKTIEDVLNENRVF